MSLHNTHSKREQMYAQFEQLKAHATTLARPGELISGHWMSEESHFARFTKGLIRQSGAVSQRELNLTLTAEQRRASLTLTLCGVFEQDRTRVERALERLREFYAAVNVRIGEVTYDDISEEFRTTDAGSMPNSVLHQIYAQNQYSTGVALFFVERITSPFGGGAIGGIAGGTPGPSLVPSTPRSGVVVATEVEPDARAIGHIMGHETGHFLGLYHTSEMLVQNTHDQLDDTPQGQEGNTNLMFPTVTAGDASLSQDQGWVMRRNMNVFPDHLASEGAE